MSEHIGSMEKKAYLRILTQLSRANGDLDEGELSQIDRIAEELGTEVKGRDLEPFDLSELAGRIQATSLRDRLFESDLAAVIAADGAIAGEELEVVKYLAERWKREAPDLEGVDWSTVKAPASLRSELKGRQRVRQDIESRSGAGWRRIQQISVLSAMKIGFILGVLYASVSLILALIQNDFDDRMILLAVGQALVSTFSFLVLAFALNLTGGVRVYIGD